MSQRLVLDDWQVKVLASQGNIVLRSGRQVGKSTVVSIKAAEFALSGNGLSILIIAAVERQAQLLFEKVLDFMMTHHRSLIKRGNDRPTKHVIKLVNGSIIRCLPTGLSGLGIRGFTVDLLIADEAAFIPEAVWTAVTPMLAATRGVLWLLSTPHGKGGFFFSCFSDDNFESFHISSEDCPRISKEFLERERKRMSRVQYAQEYLGEFVDELRQFFASDLIRSCMLLSREAVISERQGRTYLGVDVARMGGDETVLLSVEKLGESVKMIDLEVSVRTLLTETIARIKASDLKFEDRKSVV